MGPCFVLHDLALVLEKVNSWQVHLVKCKIKLAVVSWEALFVSLTVLEVHSCGIIGSSILHWSKIAFISQFVN